MPSLSTFDLVRRYGTTALAGFLALVALFLALHLARLSLLIVAGLVEKAMRRVDAAVTARASYPPPPPRHRARSTSAPT